MFFGLICFAKSAIFINALVLFYVSYFPRSTILSAKISAAKISSDAWCIMHQAEILR